MRNPWNDCLDAQDRLERWGALHAPIQRCADSEDIGRYILNSTPFGVYFLLGTDNMPARENPESKVQIMFKVQPRDRLAALKGSVIEHLPGWRVEKEEVLPATDGFPPVPSMTMIRPERAG